jgi:hypothetical protein
LRFPIRAPNRRLTLVDEKSSQRIDNYVAGGLFALGAVELEQSRQVDWQPDVQPTQLGAVTLSRVRPDRGRRLYCSDVEHAPFAFRGLWRRWFGDRHIVLGSVLPAERIVWLCCRRGDGRGSAA